MKLLKMAIFVLTNTLKATIWNKKLMMRMMLVFGRLWIKEMRELIFGLMILNDSYFSHEHVIFNAAYEEEETKSKKMKKTFRILADLTL